MPGFQNLPDRIVGRIHEADLSVEPRITAASLRFRNILNDLAGTEESRQQLEREAIAASENIKSSLSKSTILKHERIAGQWQDYARAVSGRQLVHAEVWSSEIVGAYMYGFISFLVKVSTPRKGHATIKASTLVSWYLTFVTLVMQYMRDDEGTLCAFAFFRTGGRLRKLGDLVQQLVFKYKLSRVQNPKLACGRYEIAMVISYILEQPILSSDMRIHAFETILVLLLVFSTTMRPSTICGADERALEKERYMKVGDFQFFIESDMQWTVRLHLSNFKCHSGAVASEQWHKFHSLKMPHNILLDITFWAFMYFYYRGLFKTKFQSFLDLCDSADNAQLEIDPEKLNEPLVLACMPGHNPRFIIPHKPITSTGLSYRIRHYTGAAGIGKKGLYDARRDSGNDFGLKLSQSIGAQIMNHRDAQSIYTKHYAKGAGLNFNLQGVRLGKEAGTLEKTAGQVDQAWVDKKMYLSLAVEGMVRLSSGASKLAPDDIKTLLDKNPAIKEHQQKLDAEWEALTDCLTSKDVDVWSRNLRGVYKALRAAQNQANRHLSFTEDVSDSDNTSLSLFVPEKLSAARESLLNLRDLYVSFGIIKRKENREIQKDHQFKQNMSFKKGTLTGSIEERDIAKQKLLEPAHQIIEASKDALAALSNAISNQDTPISDATLGIVCPDDMTQANTEMWLANVHQEIECSANEEEDEVHANSQSTRLLSALDGFIRLDETTDTDEAREIGVTGEQPTLEELEAHETDTLKIPIKHLRRALFARIIEPLEEHRLFEMTKLTLEQIDTHVTNPRPGKPYYPCPQCPGIYADSFYKYKRHYFYIHSPWPVFMAQFRGHGSGFLLRCPFNDYEGAGVRKMEVHLLQECVNSKHNQLLYNEYTKELEVHHPQKDNNEELDHFDVEKVSKVKEKQPKLKEKKQQVATRKRPRENTPDDESDKEEGSSSMNKPFQYLETIELKDMKRKLQTKKILPVLLNLFSDLCVEAEQHGVDLSAVAVLPQA